MVSVLLIFLEAQHTSPFAFEPQHVGAPPDKMKRWYGGSMVHSLSRLLAFLAWIDRLHRSASLHPYIHFIFLEFPKTTDSMGRHGLIADPFVNRIPLDAEIGANFIYKENSGTLLTMLTNYSR